MHTKQNRSGFIHYLRLKGVHPEKHPLPFSSSNILLLSMTTYNMEYVFYQFGSPVLTPSLLVHLQLLTGAVNSEAKKPLTLGKHCVTVTKTFLYYQHRFGDKSKT